jgi:hypothetical protein
VAKRNDVGPLPPPPVESEPRRVRVTIELPSETKRTHGTIVEGTYTVADDGLLCVCDMGGRLYTERLGPSVKSMASTARFTTRSSIRRRTTSRLIQSDCRV